VLKKNNSTDEDAHKKREKKSAQEIQVRSAQKAKQTGERLDATGVQPYGVGGGMGIGPEPVETPWRKTNDINEQINNYDSGYGPGSDMQGNYCGLSRASDPRTPCGTHADKLATSNPPLHCSLPDRSSTACHRR
jgi:hypothetical protein